MIAGGLPFLRQSLLLDRGGRGHYTEWCPALPDDLIGGTAGCGGGFVHDRFRSGGGPHPTRANARPTFPLGEGSANAVQLLNVVPPKKAFPWGEGGCEADE